MAEHSTPWIEHRAHGPDMHSQPREILCRRANERCGRWTIDEFRETGLVESFAPTHKIFLLDKERDHGKCRRIWNADYHYLQ
jgi:hypothetical protein